MKRRFLVFGIIAALMLTLFTVTPALAEEAGAAVDAPKIGVIFYSKEDNLGQCVYAKLNHAAEVLGCEIQWAIGSYPPEQQLADAENLISAGVDGILIMPNADTANQSIIKLCEENKVYYSVCFRDILDPNVKEVVEASPMYASNCYEDELTAGKALAKAVADTGRTKVCTILFNPSMGLATRNEGIGLGIEEYGLEELGSYTLVGYADPKEITDAVSNFLQLYPDCEAIISASSSQGMGEAVINLLTTMTDPGDVVYSTFDVWEGMADAFSQGYLAGTCAGMSYDALFSFIALYNYVTGQPMTESGAAHLFWNELVLTSAEDCAEFEKYIDKPDVQVYSDETIKNLVGASEEDFRDLMSQFNLDYVKSQVGENNN